MGAYDQAARLAAGTEPEAVVSRTLAGHGMGLRFREWAESRTTPLPGERDRTADRVAILSDENNPLQPWLMLQEFQTEHDPEKLDITLIEVARLRTEIRHGPDRQGKYKVLAAMIYLKGQCPRTEVDMRVSSGRGTWHGPLIWNVNEDRATEVLDAVAARQISWGMLFWIPLMQGGGEPGIITRWKELVVQFPPERNRSDLGRIALVFAELAGCYLAWEKGLEGFKMTESKVVNSWIEEAVNAEGLRTRREDIIRLLHRRFPGAIPAEVIETINSQPSRSLLGDWLDEAGTANTLEEFIAVLRR